MKRLPTTLEKLTTAECRLAEQAALLKKQRDALTRQRKRMERKAQEQQWQLVGQLIEECGFPIDDLDGLKALFSSWQHGGITPAPKQAMSSTASAALAPQEPEAR